MLLACNGFIITWILNQIIIYSNEVKLAAGQNNVPLTYLLPFYLINDMINNDVHVSKLTWRQFFSCHNIHVYSISIFYSKGKNPGQKARMFMHKTKYDKLVYIPNNELTLPVDKYVGWKVCALLVWNNISRFDKSTQRFKPAKERTWYLYIE